LQPPIPEEYHGLKPTCAMKMTVSADERVRRLRDFSSSLFVLTAHSLLALWIPALSFFLFLSSIALRLPRYPSSWASDFAPPTSGLTLALGCSRLFISIRLPISREWCLLTKYYQRRSKNSPNIKPTSNHFSFSSISISPLCADE
jgi:hypothetical protein